MYMSEELNVKESIRKMEKYINEKTSFSMQSKFEKGEYKIRLDGMEKYTVKKSWELKNLVEDVYGDAVSFNGSFQTLDRFIKDSPKDVKIYIGKVFYMK